MDQRNTFSHISLLNKYTANAIFYMCAQFSIVLSSVVAKSTRLGSDIQSIQYRYQHHLSRMFNKTKSNYLNSKSLYIQAYTPLSTFAIHFELSNFKFPGKKTIIINRNNSLKTALIIITHYIRTFTRDSFSCHRSVRLIVN